MTRPSPHVEQPNPAISSCHGKRTFRSPQLAWKIVDRQRRGHVNREPYRCEVCGRWHITGRGR